MSEKNKNNMDDALSEISDDIEIPESEISEGEFLQLAENLKRLKKESVRGEETEISPQEEQLRLVLANIESRIEELDTEKERLDHQRKELERQILKLKGDAQKAA